MTAKWEQIPTEFTINDIGAYLMANLAKGLYTGPEVIREYIQNAVDSYVEFTDQIPDQPENEVRVDIQDSSILIYDRGIGMGEKEIQEAKKIALPTKPQKDPHYVGFRKLGIWSGLTACKKLIIETSKFSEPYKYRMTMNFENIARNVDKPISIKELLDPNVSIERTEEKQEEHYTEVELQDVLPQYDDLLNLEKLKQVIIDHCPIHLASSFPYSGSIEEKLKKEGINFYKVFVKGEPIYRDFPNKVIQPEWSEIKIKDRIVAISWHCLNQEPGKLDLDNQYQRRNISLRIKNFAVGERGIYSLAEHSNFGPIDSPGNLDWYAGEVHILDNEIIPDTPRRRLEDSAYSRMFIEELRKFYNRLTQSTRVHSAFISGKKHIKDAKEALEKFEKNPLEENKYILKKTFDLLEEDEKKSKTTSKSGVAKEQAKVLGRKEIRDERRVLIKRISKTFEKKENLKIPKKITKKPSSSIEEIPVHIPSSDYEMQLLGSISKPEELFQAILNIISEVLEEDSEEYKLISSQIENLFKKLGLF